MEVKVGSKYRHFKGHIVEVIAIGTHSETLEKMVVYKHLEQNKIWIRPYNLFVDAQDVTGRKDNVTGQKTRFVEYDK